VVVDPELGALYGRHICGWLGVVWRGVKCACLAWRGRCTESRPELETVNK